MTKHRTVERVQTGVKHVEEHDEPVFEWKCVPEPAETDGPLANTKGTQ